MKEKFIKLLKKTRRPGIDKLIDYLENETDFFVAPASSRYHLAKKHGLLEHSMHVFEELCKDECNSSRIIVSLLHDVCKANFYGVEMRNVKENEKWIQKPFYKIDDQLPLGHGEKSVIIIQQFINLSVEEIMAIRWHMGGFESQNNFSALSKAFSQWTLALELHIADMRANYILEKGQ